MYTISALWTQAREGLDVTTVVYNNGAYAILRAELQQVGAAGSSSATGRAPGRCWTSTGPGSTSSRWRAAWACPRPRWTPPRGWPRRSAGRRPSPARTSSRRGAAVSCSSAVVPTAAQSHEIGPLVARRATARRAASPCVPIPPIGRATYAFRWGAAGRAQRGARQHSAERVRMTGIGTIDDCGRVGHACLIPDSEDHLWEATAAFVADGLAAGERVVYFENDTADNLLGRLADDRVPVSGALADGGLVIVPTSARASSARSPCADIVELMRQTICESESERVAGHPARGRVPRAAADRWAAQARRVRDGRRRPAGPAPERRYALPVRSALL